MPNHQRDEAVEFFKGKIIQVLNKKTTEGVLLNLRDWIKGHAPGETPHADLAAYLASLRPEAFASIVLEAARSVIQVALIERGQMLRDFANSRRTTITTVMSQEKLGQSPLNPLQQRMTHRVHTAIEHVIFVIATILNKRDFDPIQEKIDAVAGSDHHDLRQRCFNHIFEYFLTLKSISSSVQLCKVMVFDIEELVTEGMLADGVIDPAERRELLFQRSFILHEVSCVVWRYLETIDVRGMDGIFQIYQEVEHLIQASDMDDQWTIDDARNRQLGRDTIKTIRNLVAERRRIRQATQKSWAEYMDKLTKESEQAREFKRHAGMIEVISAETFQQISFLDKPTISGLPEKSIDDLKKLLERAETAFDLIEPEDFLDLFDLGDRR